MKISYFPWTDVILLVLAIAGSCTFFLISNISFWFMIPVIVFAYFITMRDAFIIVLDAERLKITSFNFLISSHLISRRSIIKINSIQTLEDETYEVYGAPYLTLKRRYELEYLDTQGKKITAYFSFSNWEKEKRIIESLDTLRYQSPFPPPPPKS